MMISRNMGQLDSQLKQGKRLQKDQQQYKQYFWMSNLECAHPLIAELVLWIQSVNFQYKQLGFQKIKRKVLRQDVRKLNKSHFVSMNSTIDRNQISFSNYSSISDFKPVDQNYSSVRIVDYETHGLKKDIKNDLAKKIQYTTIQLFSKEHFLQSWMVKQNIDLLMPQRYPFSDYAVKKIISYNEQALNAVKKITLSNFCKHNLRHKSGFFSQYQKNPLKYKKISICASLTNLQQDQNEIALQAFEYLLKAGGQSETSFNYLYEINKLIELIHGANDNLKEQVFLQVIKQISSKKIIYVRIMCCLCYSVKLSTRMYIPLLNYFYQQATLFLNLPEELLSYCFFHVIKNFDRQKKFTPSLFELYCAFHASKIPIVISFPKQKVFFIESYTTVQQLKSELIEYYNLDANVQYLFQINGYLMEKGCLLDNFNNFCQSQEQDYKWKDYKEMKGLFALIVLKNVTDINNSPRCHSIMYNYCAHQYIRGLYFLRSPDIVKIAALKMHSQMEDDQHYEFQYSNLITKRKLRKLTGKQLPNYKKHILKHYFKIKYLNKIEARRQILDILSKSKGYNTHFFKAEIYIEDYDEVAAWVGIQKERFIFIEPNTGRVMRTIAYNRIQKWGSSKTELCLKVDVIGEFHIICKQVDVLASIFQSYINYHTQLITH